MPSVISQGGVNDLTRTRTTTSVPVEYGPILLDGPVGSWGDFLSRQPGAIDPMTVWRTQPSVRKVVDFIARAIASTPLKVYDRASDTDRRRVTDHPLARILAVPAAGVTPYRFWYAVVADWMLFDRWAALKAASTDSARGIDLIRLQAARTSFADDGLARVSALWVDGKTRLDPAACLFDHGYSPLGANGTSPMQTLSAILQEGAEAVAYRRSVWRNGARIPVVIERPATAPAWSPEALARFKAGWSAYARGGGSEGGTPVLEDGMQAKNVDAFKPRDTNDLEGRQFNDSEVASAFQIAPELVGARQGTYSNVDAFRQMKYRDSLGPIYVAWEQVLNAMLVPDLDPTGTLYVEADLDAKLRGSFDEQAAVLSTSVGAPWLSRNEARARQNLPAVVGGDDIVTPLNVLVGGQASPRDAGTQNAGKSATRGLKARAEDTYEQRATEALTGFYEKQRDQVLKALGGKAGDGWWDGEQWDAELTATTFGLSMMIADQIGEQAAESLGYKRGDYDAARTQAFLKTVAADRAANINATTKAQLDAALASDGSLTPADVFALAIAQRAAAAASQLVTHSSGFGTTEAARQLSGGKATKTWETGRNPRASHQAMNGQTVGIDEKFSNGLDWPGDGGDPNEVAGCNCGVSIRIP